MEADRRIGVSWLHSSGKVVAALNRGGILWTAVLTLTALLLASWAAEAAEHPPTAPGNLTASFVVGEGVTLNWDPPSEDADSVTGYQILRRLPSQGEQKLAIYVADTAWPNN